MRGTIFVTWCYFSPCVPVVKRLDPTLTDKEAKIEHPKFLDIVDSYDVFHHARFIVNFNRETYGIVKNWQIINTLYIDMFCYIRLQPTRTPFYNLNRLHRFTMLPSHLYSSRLLEFLRIFKNLALLGIHLKICIHTRYKYIKKYLFSLLHRTFG